MKLSGSHSIPAPRQRVFAALMDAEVLARCIEGCERLTLRADGVYDVQLKVGSAAIKGTYKGTVKILERRDPESFTLAIEGRGLPGFVQSRSSIRLREKDGRTELAYDAEATVGGVIAAVGSRLVEGFARKVTADFFARFEKEFAAAG